MSNLRSQYNLPYDFNNYMGDIDLQHGGTFYTLPVGNQDFYNEEFYVLEIFESDRPWILGRHGQYVYVPDKTKVQEVFKTSGLDLPDIDFDNLSSFEKMLIIDMMKSNGSYGGYLVEGFPVHYYIYVDDIDMVDKADRKDVKILQGNDIFGYLLRQGFLDSFIEVDRQLFDELVADTVGLG